MPAATDSVAGYFTAADHLSLTGKADDTKVVHNTGAENIDGIKTFLDGEVLALDAQTPMATPVYFFNAVGSQNTYYEASFQNKSAGVLASTDIILNNGASTPAANYVDLGINGNSFSNAAWTISGPSDGYLYVQGNNLTLGTDTPGKTVAFHTGGLLTANIRLTLSDSLAAFTVGAQSDVGFNFNQVPNPNTGSLALVLAAGVVDVGLHYYAVTYTTALGETRGYIIGSVTTDGTHGQVNVTIPTSADYRVTGRKLYRTKAGGSNYQTFLLATIPDNTTTLYVDNAADASLVTAGGYYQVNSTTKNLTINNVKAMTLDAMGTYYGINAGASVTSGGQNSFFGNVAGAGLTTGVMNSAFGDHAAFALTTGVDNALCGAYAGSGIVGGSANVCLGRNTLGGFNGTSSYNVAVGYYALGAGAGAAFDKNVALGMFAGYAYQQANAIFVGAYAGRWETTQANTLIIDNLDRTNQALARSGALIYGVSNATPANNTLQLGGGGVVTIPGNTVLAGGAKWTSPTVGYGYATGAGGAVTQLTSQATGVTLSKPCGVITLFSAAGSTTPVSFVVTNTLVAATDNIILTQQSGANLYALFVTHVAAGSFTISLWSFSGTAAEAPAINFAIIKAVNS
jgi:hypothetical protein